MKPIARLARLAALGACSLVASAAFAQSTAFTYQGKLNNNAQPAEGTHDFRFKLFDAATGGTQLGTTQCVDNLSVTGGVFTATIDFGQQYITTGQRFLEIEVRKDTGLACSNLGGLVILSPRQPLTATPLASSAKSAFSLAAADGSPAQAVVVDNAGNVGIGTAAPTHNLHIATVGPTLALQDNDSSGGAGGQQVGYVSYRDSGNIERAWVGYGSAGDPDFSIINVRPGGDIVLNTFSNGGKVGIGTPSPQAALHVAGSGIFEGSLTIASTDRSYAIHPYELVDPTPGVGGNTLFHDDNGLQVFGNPNTFATSIHLPDGATITGFEAYGHDGAASIGADIITTLGRTTLSGTAGSLGFSSSTIGGSVWKNVLGISHLVDNDANSYWIRVSLGGGVPPFDTTLTGIRIMYKVTSPLP